MLRTRSLKNSILFPSALLVALASGCSTMSVPPMTVRPTEWYALKSETRGLTVVVNPVTSKQEIDATFKTDLLAKGIVPILIVVENKNPSASFVVSKEKVAVVDNETAVRTTSANPTVRSSTGGEVATIAGAALISLPLVVVGLKVASDAQVIQHNLADKALYTQTVGPGQRAQGYLYFQAPAGRPLAGNHHVLIEVRDSATNEPLTFDFPIR